MIRLKRKLRKHFEIINIDEFNTSKLNHKTENECENLRKTIITKNGKTHKIELPKNIFN